MGRFVNRLPGPSRSGVGWLGDFSLGKVEFRGEVTGEGEPRKIDVNRAISAALDRDDPLPGGRYTLEVTSPGVERPLRTPEQFQRFVGSDVSVKTRPGTDGERRVAGRLTHADGSGVVIVGPDLPEEGRPIAYADIERARTTFAWGPTEPGRGDPRRARRGPHRPSPHATKKATTS